MTGQPARTGTTLFNRLIATLEWIMGVIIFAMMMLTFVDVIGRYLLNKPVPGAAEFVSFLLAVSLFAGIAIVSGENRHIAVTLFQPMLDRRMKRLRITIVRVFSVLTMALIAAEMFRHTFRMIEFGRSTIVLDWPLWPITLLMAIAGAVTVLLMILRRGDGEPGHGEEHEL
jgi:TRAP-type C4-dicarboxylate transport system permease small subunit